MIMVCNNPQIWRIAEWLYQNLSDDAYYAFDDKVNTSLLELSLDEQKFYYDKAVELQRKLQNNGFTGKDDHAD